TSASRNQIAPNVRHDRMRLAGLKRDWLLEHRPRVHARVELAALATRIDLGRQVAQQRPIEFAAGEASVETPRVDAREARAKTAIDHLFGELIGRDPPHRKERLEACAREMLFAIPTNVFEKQI